MKPSSLSIPEARLLVKDLVAPKPWIFCADLLFCGVLGWAAFFASLQFSMGSAPHFSLLLGSILLLFRALMFVHPIFHLPASTQRWMVPLYNVLAGVPFLVPFFFFQGSHAIHHRGSRFGTELDAEYLPPSARGRGAMIARALTTFVGSFALLARFGVVSPLSFFIPPLRRWVRARASALTLRTDFVRTYGLEDSWGVQEWSCSLALWATAFGLWRGLIPLPTVLQWLFVGWLLGVINLMQIYALHRYRGSEAPREFEEQLEDSNNTPGRVPFITALWAPVGQRFHGLHHLFPSLPYHHMPEAHRRLMRGLPPDSVYQRTERRGWWDAVTKP